MQQTATVRWKSWIGLDKITVKQFMSWIFCERLFFCVSQFLYGKCWLTNFLYFSKKTTKEKQKGKAARKWGNGGNANDVVNLDFSKETKPATNGHAALEEEVSEEQVSELLNGAGKPIY